MIGKGSESDPWRIAFSHPAVVTRVTLTPQKRDAAISVAASTNPLEGTLKQTITTNADRGSFTLSYKGASTNPIAHNAPAIGGSVKEALEKLPDIHNVTVTNSASSKTAEC